MSVGFFPYLGGLESNFKDVTLSELEGGGRKRFFEFFLI